MKLNKFLWSLAAISALCLASCSADKLADEPEINPADLTDARYLAVTISTAPESRADYEEGSAAENTVTRSRFYFFNADGTACAVSATSNNAPATGTSIEPTAVNWINAGALSPVGSNMDNVEKLLQTVLIIRTPSRDKTDPTPTVPAKMAVCLNLPTDFTSDKLSLPELEAKVADYSVHTDGNFILTSTVYAETTASPITKIVTVDIANTDLKDSEQAAILAPVTVYVERVVAKVRLTLKNTDGTIDIENAKTSGTGVSQIVYCKTGQTIDLDGDDNTPEVDIYAKLEPWYLTAESNVSYLIKNINTTNWTAALPWSGWNSTERKRSFWAVNPLATGTPAWDVVYHKYTAGDGNTDKGKIPASNFTDANWLYTQENANYDNAASKTNTLKNTKVLVKATLGYFTDASDVTSFKTIEFGTFGTIRYPITSTKDYLATAILEYLKTQGALPYYYQDTTDPTKFHQIEESDISYVTVSSLISGYDGTRTDGVTPVHLATEKRYEVRVQLSETGAAKIWYVKDGATDADAYGYVDSSTWDAKTDTEKKAASSAAVNASLLTAVNPVMVWKNGATYYFFDIKHLNTTGTFTKGNEPEGYFGVVRNHIYDCTINGVTGLGTPVYNPDEYIIPETVDDDIYTAVAASINIHSWRIVTNSYTLGE